jgi:phenylacetate-CoA ligase
VKQTEWYGRDQIARYQDRELSQLLLHAFKTVPFYRRKFREAGITPEDVKRTDDLVKLPVLTKAEIRRNHADLISTAVPRGYLVPGRTGGSTGEPTRFFHDRRSLDWISAVRMRNVERAGFRWGQRHVYLSGSHFDYSQSMKLKVKFRNLILRRKPLSFAGIDEKRMGEYLQYIQNWRPAALWGYASALYFLALFTRERVGSLKVQSIISSSETLLPYQRELVEEVFGCRVLDYYASREFSVGCECEEHKGFHIDAEAVIVEVVKEGIPLSVGEVGEILVTDLRNYGFPFIRYAIGDLGSLSSRECACGRGLPIIESVKGRVSDVIVTSDGRLVAPPAFATLFGDVDGVEQYQLVHDSIERLVVNIVRNDNYTDADTAYLRQCLRRMLGEKTRLVFRFVDNIPVGESGKRRTVVSTVSRDRL